MLIGEKMLKGILKVLDTKQMELLHDSALDVLEKTGLQIQGRFLLEALADAGCRVDFEQHRAWLKPELVEKQIKPLRDRYKHVRSSLWYPFCEKMPKDDVCWPDEFTIDYGYATPWIYDYQLDRYRSPTVQDQIEAIKLGNALDSAKAINAPYICAEFDSRTEIIESARILLMNTTKPGWVGTSCGAEVKYLAKMSELALEYNSDIGDAKKQPPIFVHAYCTTSPLKVDTRSCEVLKEALKYKFPVNFAPMPILGATTPITPAGSAVVAIAEILGCITATSLIEPDINYYATSISSEMDMRSSQVCFCTPAAILTDAMLHQFFREKHGIVLNVESAYVEAKKPGIQAAFMKVFRQMAFGATVSSSMPVGLLDNGSAFSPTQAMIDLDMNRAIYGFAKGAEVSPASINIDLINELQFCDKQTYLESEHTFKFFRDIVWDTTVFDRTYREDEIGCVESNEQILKKADKQWRQLVAEQPEIEVDSKFKKQLDEIVEAAKKELLS